VLTHAAWGAKLNLEQYLEREQRLASHPFSRDNLSTWVLASEGDILASCETYRMDSVMRGEGDATRTGHTYGVATVFVETKLRAQGYATDLLRHLLEQMTRTDEEAQASVLFSEVGPDIYEKVGYVARPAVSRIYEPAPEAGAELVADPIQFDEVPEVLASTSHHAPRQRFRVIPTPEQLDWHMERARYYAGVLDRLPPEVAGARADEAWALWTPDFKNERLVILDLAPGLPDGTRVVIEAARREARKHELREVLLWENPENADGLVGGESVERQADIPMIAPLVDGVEPEQWCDYSRSLWV
jgi:GNAT superfamily N-acetyltransferase